MAPAQPLNGHPMKVLGVKVVCGLDLTHKTSIYLICCINRSLWTNICNVTHPIIIPCANLRRIASFPGQHLGNDYEVSILILQ